MVHDGVDQCLQLLDPVFNKLLMLIMWLTLPIINAVSMQDFLDLVADFDLYPITDELGGGFPCPYLILKSVDDQS